MADLLQSLIAGTDPQAQAELAAYQNEQGVTNAQDPSRWTIQQFGPFASLNRQMALGQSMAASQDAVGKIAANNVAALPDLAQMYASPDIAQWAANNPGANPIALSRALQGSPADVEAARGAGLQTYLSSLAVNPYRQRLGLPLLPGYGTPPSSGGAAAPTPAPLGATGGSTGVTPAGRGYVPVLPSGSLGSGHYAAPAGNSVPGTIDPSQVPPGALPAYVQRLPAPQRAAYLNLLRQRLAHQAPASSATPAATPAGP